MFVISGVVGTGKSSVSDALMRRFNRGIHISVDDIRSWVASGYADPTEPWNDETDRQFRMARESAAWLARRYSDEGFAVAIDDVLWPHEFEEVFTPVLGDRAVYRVLLHAPLRVTLDRNATRSNKNFDTSVLEATIRMLHERINPSPEQWPGWLILDTSGMTIAETVDEIVTQTSNRT